MPKSKQRKGHKEKKAKFLKLQKDAKTLAKHRQDKFLQDLFAKMNKQNEERQMQEATASSPLIEDAKVIEEITDGLQELKEGIEQNINETEVVSENDTQA